jgi:hypothetical protein
MNQNKKPTEPGRGYVDGIKNYYSFNEMMELFIAAINKELSKDDPLEGRAYIVIKAIPDADMGTVLRPAINFETGQLSEEKFGAEHYTYGSKYEGRQSVLHKEIVENEKEWFTRIN